METHKIHPVKILAFASFAVLLNFLWQGHKGFSLWDEGFLWYGAQRVLLSEVPKLDFMAYDPGRYYWCALLMKLWGDTGIMALRWAIAVFQALGLFVGLSMLYVRNPIKKQTFLYLLLSTLTLLTWMEPRHKLFDISLSIFTVGVLTYLVQKPTIRRYFVSGFCVGLTAVFGRNHGVYALLGTMGVMSWLCMERIHRSNLFKNLIAFTLGGCVGFLPIIFMCLFITDFAEAFLESVRFLYELKSTNLHLPIPWPWQVSFQASSWVESLRRFLMGLFFVFLPLFGVLSLAWAVQQKFRKNKVSPVLIASFFLVLPYSHYAFSRADVGHLAQGIPPFLIAVLALLQHQSPRVKWSLALALLGVSFYVTAPLHPGWQCLKDQCVEIDVSKNTLLVDRGVAGDVELLRNLAGQYTPQGEAFLTAPLWPGAYSLLGRKSPLWEIYALRPRSEAFQQEEIERIKKANPRFALLVDFPLDGKDELRFKNTHPLIHQYILDQYERVPLPEKPLYQLYLAKEKHSGAGSNPSH